MRPVRLGLIGVGRWGKVYLATLASLRARCRLTDLCTSDPDNAQRVPYPVRVMRDWRRVVRGGCDAVIVASPPETHAEILAACLAVGKPCIVEKPLCLDLATARRLHRRTTSSGALVLVDHTHLFHPAYERLTRALREADEPIRLLISEGMNLGPFRSHTAALWDWAPHDLSLCLDLMGRRPTGVAALAGPAGPDGHPEAVSMRVDFRGPAQAWIQVGRLSVQKRRSLSVFTTNQLYVWDTRAPVTLKAARISFARRYAGGIPEQPVFRAIPVRSGRTAMERMLTYFLNGLQGGDRRYFGTSLALDVTSVLARCEQRISSEGA